MNTAAAQNRERQRAAATQPSEVYVGPRVEDFVVEAVRSIMDKFLLRKPMAWSDLLSTP
jgi:hypothetical protein